MKNEKFSSQLNTYFEAHMRFRSRRNYSKRTEREREREKN
jgi:hypothetical protein